MGGSDSGQAGGHSTRSALTRLPAGPIGEDDTLPTNAGGVRLIEVPGASYRKLRRQVFPPKRYFIPQPHPAN